MVFIPYCSWYVLQVVLLNAHYTLLLWWLHNTETRSLKHFLDTLGPRAMHLYYTCQIDTLMQDLENIIEVDLLTTLGYISFIIKVIWIFFCMWSMVPGKTVNSCSSCDSSSFFISPSIMRLNYWIPCSSSLQQ